MRLLLLLCVFFVAGCGIRAIVPVPTSPLGEPVEQAEAKARTAEVAGASANVRAKNAREEADAATRLADDLRGQLALADSKVTAATKRAEAADTQAFKSQVRGWALAGGIISAIGMAICAGMWAWSPFGKTVIAGVGTSFAALAGLSALVGILAPVVTWGPWLAIGLVALIAAGLAALVVLAIRRLHQAGVVTAGQWSSFASFLPPDARKQLDDASMLAQPAHLRPLVTAFLTGG